jgi:hypothetical protein
MINDGPAEVKRRGEGRRGGMEARWDGGEGERRRSCADGVGPGDGDGVGWRRSVIAPR